jgi:hypothetical protein
MTPLEVISTAAAFAGTLDLLATSTLLRTQNIHFEQLLQTIASGALGRSSFQRGKVSATAGFFFHFLIALIVAAAYYTMSRKLNVLLNHPIMSGVFYGMAVHLVMSRIVVPISAAPKRAFSAKAFLIQLFIHIIFVGLPIALTISRLSR